MNNPDDQLLLARAICVQRCYAESTGHPLRTEDANLSEQLEAWLSNNRDLVPCDENGEIAPTAADFAEAASGFDDEPEAI